MSIIQYSESRIGQQWTEVDHLALLICLRKIDELVQEVHRQFVSSAKEPLTSQSSGAIR